jgi:hypothetical protein
MALFEQGSDMVAFLCLHIPAHWETLGLLFQLFSDKIIFTVLQVKITNKGVKFY